MKKSNANMIALLSGAALNLSNVTSSDAATKAILARIVELANANPVYDEAAAEAHTQGAEEPDVQPEANGCDCGDVACKLSNVLLGLREGDIDALVSELSEQHGVNTPDELKSVVDFVMAKVEAGAVDDPMTVVTRLAVEFVPVVEKARQAFLRSKGNPDVVETKDADVRVRTIEVKDPAQVKALLNALGIKP